LRIDLDLRSTRGAQNVQSRAIAVKDLEAKARSLSDTVGVVVDHRHLRAPRQQHLQGDLTKAPEADHQNLTTQPVRRIHAIQGGAGVAQQPVGGDHYQRRDRH
jgi:hypothetical protein